MSELSLIALVSLAMLAVWWDLRERRIPKALTLTGCAVAIALRSFQGFEALGAGALGLVLGVAVSLPLVAAGVMGGGDAKLMAAVGAFLGPFQFVVAVAITALAGGLLAVALAIRCGALHETMHHTGALILRALGIGQERPRRTLSTAGALTIPYALPIAIGAIAGWFA
ncbi:MAG TPA: prepilin peptidase [Gemmatimonadota bacterium]|nr:prepilin peptidase [Gemmatimonadota bacterium]